MPYFIVILICKISETYEAFFYFSRALSLDKCNFSNLYFQDLSIFFQGFILWMPVYCLRLMQGYIITLKDIPKLFLFGSINGFYPHWQSLFHKCICTLKRVWLQRDFHCISVSSQFTIFLPFFNLNFGGSKSHEELQFQSPQNAPCRNIIIDNWVHL